MVFFFAEKTDAAASAGMVVIPPKNKDVCRECDKALWRQDIDGSLAHVAMLAAQGIIPVGDADAITAGSAIS